MLYLNSQVSFNVCTFVSSPYGSLLQYQTAQLTHVLDERLKEFAKEADQEKALKEVAAATTKEKGEVSRPPRRKIGRGRKLC